MAYVQQRTPSGRWGKERHGEFAVGSGKGEIVNGRSTGKIRAVRFHVGEDWAVEIDVANIRAMLDFVEKVEADDAKKGY